MPRCAVCLVALVQGDKYGLVDEFVVHRRCMGGSIVLREKAVNGDRELARANQQIATLERRVADERENNRDLRERLRTADHQRLDLRAEVEGLRAALAQRDIELANERSMRALAELEARSRPQPPPRQETAQETEQISEPVDITAARFSLLELD